MTDVTLVLSERIANQLETTLERITTDPSITSTELETLLWLQWYLREGKEKNALRDKLAALKT